MAVSYDFLMAGIGKNDKALGNKKKIDHHFQCNNRNYCNNLFLSFVILSELKKIMGSKY